MNKRHFLKATGLSVAASLLASSFFGREKSQAAAQEPDLVAQLAELREQLQNETKARKDSDDGIKRQLELSFIGTVTAIASESVPYGWHPCDGTEIPMTREFELLRSMTGLTHFPDYRGVFLRGVDDGAQKDPGRELNSYQGDDNKSHVHACDSSKHTHQTNPAGNHNHMTDVFPEHPAHCVAAFTGGNQAVAKYSDSRRSGEVDVGKAYGIPTDGNHAHDIPASGDHSHTIQASGSESRPKNVSVRYVIRYA